MIVCVCNNVSDKAIRKAVEQNGVRTYIQLQRTTQTGTCCGKCTSCAKQVLKDAVETYEAQMLADLEDLAFA
ncbi:(2Fe-2S)-binding protein [Chitinibacter fontanus]|uniref:Bacterioferritin-associated ferredoxin n=1 Tax=Chitinibacter fontanus TaxID=1737446 RepID=A0A7D5VB30_9NEIS|nr:(2Fe-2S)-binding protein [Chitinibacter fontanus]QLI82418.1 (2Fe-2S)-binding protein [Chitinibacter fontanus]